MFIISDPVQLFPVLQPNLQSAHHTINISVVLTTITDCYGNWVNYAAFIIHISTLSQNSNNITIRKQVVYKLGPKQWWNYILESLNWIACAAQDMPKIFSSQEESHPRSHPVITAKRRVYQQDLFYKCRSRNILNISFGKTMPIFNLYVLVFRLMLMNLETYSEVLQK